MTQKGIVSSLIHRSNKWE